MSYQPIDSLLVKLNFAQSSFEVGKLLANGRKIWFEYDSEFLKSPYNISPFQIKHQAGLQFEDEGTFEGLFGVFNDCLPDGWGRLLVDRQMRQLKIPPQKLTPLDRLAFVGDRGMGALTYEPMTPKESLESELDLDALAKSSLLVLDGDVDTFFDELLDFNGSSGGARPKIVAQVSEDMETISSDVSELKSGFSRWLIKFPNASDPKDIAAIEYAYSLMAKSAGIIMPKTTLFKTKNDGKYFACERFDRTQGNRFHMHTLGGIIGADHRVPSLDYDIGLKVTARLTKSQEDIDAHFRLAAFNILAHNRDDHCKNFSYLMDEQGTWRFSPAYDLTFSYGPGGEQSTTVCGEGKNPGVKDLLELAKVSNVKNVQIIIDEVLDAISKWPEFAKDSGVSSSSTEMIRKIITE